MINLIEAADELKSAPDQSLADYMLRPDGRYPPYLVLTELQSRQRMREKAGNSGPSPSTSMAEETVAKASAPRQGLQALMPGQGQPMPQQQQQQQQQPQQQHRPQPQQGQMPPVRMNSGGRPIDHMLDAIGQVESGNRHRNPDGSFVTSPAGAYGQYQIMPSSAEDFGYGVAPLRDDSPEEHRRFARDVYTTALDIFGDERKALAAYNMGIGGVQRLQAQYGDDWIQYAPEETRNYVPKVLQEAMERGYGRAEDPRDVPRADAPQGLQALAASAGLSLPEFEGTLTDRRDPMTGTLNALVQAHAAKETGGSPVALNEGGGVWEYLAGRDDPDASQAYNQGRQFSSVVSGLTWRPAVDAWNRLGRTGPTLGDIWRVAGEHGPTLGELWDGAPGDTLRGFVGANSDAGQAPPDLAPYPGGATFPAAPSVGERNAWDVTGVPEAAPEQVRQMEEAGIMEPRPDVWMPDASPSRIAQSELDRIVGGNQNPPPQGDPGDISISPAFERRERTPEEHLADIEAFMKEDPEQSRRNAWMALARAGFGMAGGDSPYFMQNVSEGALAGLDAYGETQQQEQRSERLRQLMALQSHNRDENYNQRLDEAEIATRLNSMYGGSAVAGMGAKDAAATLEKLEATADLVLGADAGAVRTKAAQGDEQAMAQLQAAREWAREHTQILSRMP